MTAIILKGTLFAALLICAAVTDIRRREVDGPVWVAMLVVSLIGPGGSFWGAAITALPFFIPAFFKSGSIGGGDIKLMFACGAVLGVWGGLLQAAIALALAVAYSFARRLSAKATLPLAPFLCAGGIVAYTIMNMGGI